MLNSEIKINKNYYPRAPIIPALLYAVLYFLFYYITRVIIFNAAYIYFVSACGGDLEAGEKMYFDNANMLSLISGIVILALLAAFFAFRKKKLSTAFYLNKSRACVILVCFFAGISLNFMTTLIISYLPPSLLESYEDASSVTMQGEALWYILAAVVMAPIIEEVIFRAMMLSRISTATGNVLAVILSSAVFGAVHGHIVWSTYAFILGCFLGTVFVRTRSIKASIATHVGFNIVSLISYIDIESTSQIMQTLFNTAISLCYSLSVPLAITFVIVLFHETSDTATPMPVGFEGNL